MVYEGTMVEVCFICCIMIIQIQIGITHVHQWFKEIYWPFKTLKCCTPDKRIFLQMFKLECCQKANPVLLTFQHYLYGAFEISWFYKYNK